jgi:signal transduction histidine kinase
MTAQTTPAILVVNDDPGSLIGLVGLVSQWKDEIGYEVYSARSGREALREVLKQDFAVILLDVNMPGMDGFETARVIHERRSSSSIPIIFVTAYLADEMNRLKGYENGAVDYLFTPFVPQALKSKLAVFVALAEQKLQLREQAHILNQRTQELVKTNQQLQMEVDRRQEAEQRTKTSEEFLAMLGHELRNPLAAIANAGMLLGMDNITEQQASTALKVIRRQTGQLTHIVDDLLDLGRVLAGKILLSKFPTDLGGIVRSSVETLTIAGRTQQHNFHMEIESGIVEADPARLEQVITNLLDNAIKYTPPGGRINVKVSTTLDEVILTVEDNGIGMSPELLSRVFEVFVQAEQSLDRPRGGLGIGLALVRQLVVLHGGSVTVDSLATKGSIFEVRLPKSSINADNTLSAVSHHGSQKLSVLLIEDNVDSCEVMQYLLASFGHQVHVANNGVDGLKIANDEVPAVALVDIGLPGMNGYEIAQQLRSAPATCTIRLIALTGYGLEHDRVRALEAGFDMHLVKPVTADRLLSAMNECMKQ